MYGTQPPSKVCGFLFHRKVDGDDWHPEIRNYLPSEGKVQVSLIISKDLGVSKNSGTPKMDGENNGNPY